MRTGRAPAKVIAKYTASDRELEINHMRIEGRHPEDDYHFVVEAAVRSSTDKGER